MLNSIIFGCVALNFTEIGKCMWTAWIEINLHPYIKNRFDCADFGETSGDSVNYRRSNFIQDLKQIRRKL